MITLAAIFEDLHVHDPAKQLMIRVDDIVYTRFVVEQVDAFTIMLVVTP